MTDAPAPRSHAAWLDPAVADYVAARTAQPDEVLRNLHDVTRAELGDSFKMQISPDQGALMTLLTGLTRAEFAVEVGTFTGYSSVCIVRGLRPGGRLLCCDVSEEYTGYARQAWADAGIADRVELRIAPALETLRSLPADEHIDVAFVDADKEPYPDYWDELVPRMRRGGLLMIDNTLRGGRVADASIDDAHTNGMRAFNDKVAGDERVTSYLLPISDGLTLARKL